MKVMHIITGLSTGGAEMMLLKLLAQTDLKQYESEVVSLTNIGPVGAQIEKLGISVRALNMPRGVLNPFAVLRLGYWIRLSAPDVVQTWMYHADLIGGIAAKLAGNCKIVWGIHNSTLDQQLSKRTTIWTARACAKLSRKIPDEIVCCSQASRAVHRKLGYEERKMVVIPNGFDLANFKPDSTARLSLRQELDIPLESNIVGLVGRFDPQKDHRGFIRAAALLEKMLPNVHFVLCGDGVEWENDELSTWAGEAGIERKIHLLGRRQDMPRIFAALDVYCNSSAFGEAFPNVVGEAMASGVPCVVTNVGDCAAMVGEVGEVVAPRDPVALSEALYKFLQFNAEERALLGRRGRCRVEENFSLSSVVACYEHLYDEVLGAH